MAKFKVGDKVRVTKASKLFGMSRLIGKVGIISHDDGSGIRQYRLDIDDPTNPWSESELELVEPRREFIVIRRDGAKTIAELRHDREVIKSGTAICNASDAFDFQTGAKLAFDRLMGREEPKPAPAPEPPKFYTGKVVCIENKRFPEKVGMIASVSNGRCSHRGWDSMLGIPYESFEIFCTANSNAKFIEVKFNV